jgi:hypothetical protein
MNFLDAVNSIEARPPGLPCGMATVLSQMSEDDRSQLEFYLFEEPRSMSNPNLHAAIKKFGYDVSKSSVALHRRKECRCFTGKTYTGAAK